jgi:3-hydroxyisobutyrate dehydrogenase
LAVCPLGEPLVECPFGGSVRPGKDGKLFGFVGGDAPGVARARPPLDQMCRRLEHCGPIDAGSRMKRAINLPLFVCWQVLGEALLLYRSLNLDSERLIAVNPDGARLAQHAREFVERCAGEVPLPGGGAARVASALVSGHRRRLRRRCASETDQK